MLNNTIIIRHILYIEKNMFTNIPFLCFFFCSNFVQNYLFLFLKSLLWELQIFKMQKKYYILYFIVISKFFSIFSSLYPIEYKNRRTEIKNYQQMFSKFPKYLTKRLGPEIIQNVKIYKPFKNIFEKYFSQRY